MIGKEISSREKKMRSIILIGRKFWNNSLTKEKEMPPIWEPLEWTPIEKCPILIRAKFKGSIPNNKSKRTLIERIWSTTSLPPKMPIKIEGFGMRTPGLPQAKAATISVMTIWTAENKCYERKREQLKKSIKMIKVKKIPTFERRLMKKSMETRSRRARWDSRMSPSSSKLRANTIKRTPIY